MMNDNERTQIINLYRKINETIQANLTGFSPETKMERIENLRNASETTVKLVNLIGVDSEERYQGMKMLIRDYSKALTDCITLLSSEEDASEKMTQMSYINEKIEQYEDERPEIGIPDIFQYGVFAEELDCCEGLRTIPKDSKIYIYSAKAQSEFIFYYLMDREQYRDLFAGFMDYSARKVFHSYPVIMPESVSDNDKTYVICVEEKPYRQYIISKLKACDLRVIELKLFDERDYFYYANLSPDLYNAELRLWYRNVTGRLLDLKNPRTFNEKLNWMKLYDRNPLKTRLADKYLVRDWVKERIGEDHLIPLLGVWDDFESIDFDALPERFVLKCNHGSGSNVIVKDKSTLDMDDARAMFQAWMSVDWAHVFGFELHYSDITKKIIAEEFIEELSGNLYDYKIHCFGGEPKFIQCIGDRDPRAHTAHQIFYDFEWNDIGWTFEDYPRFPRQVDKPDCLNEMYDIAKALSRDFPYVRVDLYDLKGRILFGEMTFTPLSGAYVYRGTFTPLKDLELGEMIDLRRKA